MQDNAKPSFNPVTTSQQQDIDDRCADFRDRWRSGRRPRIEEFLDKVAESVRGTLLEELVACEHALRQAAGEQFEIDEYYQRFPDNRAAVAAAWANLANRALRDPGPASTVNVSRDNELDTGGDPVDARDTQPPPIPDMIGRYKILRALGAGSFGRVFLAHDTELQRDVALKVPGRKRLAAATNVEAFVEEARAAARLNHPRLVTVHDIQQDGDDVYIVQEYIAGQSLSQWASANDPSPERIVSLIKEIVEAVGFAHQHDLVHRDLKPANLLVDRHGHVHVTDFGLALNESVQRLRKGEVCGTPAYMSPEQVRGLTHVLDGRSDLWSIGVILYELLTGRRPFRGANHGEVFEEVKHRHPKPPRQIKPEISAELERICLKCLAKRQTDRYASAADLLEDLEAWSRPPTTVVVAQQPTAERAADVPGSVAPLGSPPTGSTPILGQAVSNKQQAVRVVPKGLRSFDEHDADFFLELLPGARDRDGLPESVRFWKLRMEETDPDKTFRVGLIYGPSGCGKSSLLKAGLLPRLAAHVVPVYVEAAAEDTERRLLTGLRRRFATIPHELALPDVLAGIREGSWVAERTKVCLVLDQFEQWLHARRGEPNTQLVQALLHCDGGRVQSLALVRDDFWVPASRFMQDLEIRLVEGANSALVDLFDPRHARNVLAAFGRAYRALPEGPGELSREHESFLDRAVEDLLQEGKVICVRLALFADMLKGKPWTTATLSQVGGTERLGVTFLEETFSASTAPAAHRHHQQAAQAVLKALLPEAGSNIKGSRQSYEALLDISGYAQHPSEFGDLIQLLDSKIRLITPTVSEAEDVESVSTPLSISSSHLPPSAATVRYYQLTHDYLVPSLRDWLTRKQKETRRGRAQSQLSELAALWNAKPESRRLPSVSEYVNIRALTAAKSWTEPQRKMMKQAGRVHGWRTLIAVLAALVLAWLGFELYGRARARTVLTADPVNLSGAMAQLSPWHAWARHDLSQIVQGVPRDDRERREQLHARLVYAQLTHQYDPAPLTQLYSCSIPYLGVVRDVLQPHSDLLAAPLWDTLHSSEEPVGKRFRAGLALATYATDSRQWLDDDYVLLARQLVEENPIHLAQLWECLLPLSPELIPKLEKLFADRQLSESQQIAVANSLVAFAGQDGRRLARLLSMATDAQYRILYPPVADWPDETAKGELASIVAEQPTEDLPEMDRVTLGRRRAGAAISLLRLRDAASSRRAFQIREDPESLTQFVHRCRDRGVTVQDILSSLCEATDVHDRFALLLALGNYRIEEVDVAQREPLVKELCEAYRSDPSSAIHGATGWLLRRWGFGEEVALVDRTPLAYDVTGEREWYVVEIAPRSAGIPDTSAGTPANDNAVPAKIYYTFVVLPPGEYLMGSPKDEMFRQDYERVHRVKLTRPLAVSAYETTWAQYDPVDGGASHQQYQEQNSLQLTPEEPVFGVDWFEAVAYCRWLTQQAGKAEADQCYDAPTSVPKDENGNPAQWPVHLERRGFRLLTEAEWEYACRSGTRTAFSFGNDLSLVTHYAWVTDNAVNWSHPVGKLRPNSRGLFDMHGNMHEWCHDGYQSDLADHAENPTGAEASALRVGRGGSWNSPATIGRAASRNWGEPSVRTTDMGFRIATVPPVE